MLDRRAFLCVIVLGVAATGAVHAGTDRSTAVVARPAAIAAPSAQPALSMEASQRAWHHVLATYRLLLGVGAVQFGIVSDSPTINGIQDGPDGVDPLGIKGFKGLTPKYQDDPQPQQP